MERADSITGQTLEDVWPAQNFRFSCNPRANAEKGLPMHGTNIALRVSGQSLNDLAIRIRDAHASVISSYNSAIDNAIMVGKLLIEAKKQTLHGQWSKFLQRCDVGERQAQRYIKLAKLVEANPTLKSDLALAEHSIEGAITRLSPPKAPRVTTAPKPPVVTKTVVKVKTAPGKRITHLDIIELWLTTSQTDHMKAVDGFGLDAWLAAMPESWLPSAAERLTNRLAIHKAVVPPASPEATIPRDLSVPTFLDQRAPALPVPVEEEPPVAVPPVDATTADQMDDHAFEQHLEKIIYLENISKVNVSRANIWKYVIGADDLQNIIRIAQRDGVDQRCPKQFEKMKKRLAELRAHEAHLARTWPKLGAA
jgi:hypothetical protein